MTTASPALRAIAKIAMLTGYCGTRARGLVRGAYFGSRERSLRIVEAEGVRLRVPLHWGELERDSLGRLVLHNRLKRHRIDGDAVWYSTATELRILPGRQIEPRNAEAMATTRRLIKTPHGPVTLELTVANGVSSCQRAIAETVLHTAVPCKFEDHDLRGD